MCYPWGYHALGAHIKKQSIDEMKHAEALIERLARLRFFNVTPSMELDPLSLGPNLEKRLENDLALEIAAVRSYNDAIQIAQEAGDNTSRELFEPLR